MPILVEIHQVFGLQIQTNKQIDLFYVNRFKTSNFVLRKEILSHPVRKLYLFPLVLEINSLGMGLRNFFSLKLLDQTLLSMLFVHCCYLSHSNNFGRNT